MSAESKLGKVAYCPYLHDKIREAITATLARGDSFYTHRECSYPECGVEVIVKPEKDDPGHPGRQNLGLEIQSISYLSTDKEDIERECSFVREEKSVDEVPVYESNGRLV